ncbi:MAG: UDP-N-acetylglucosamine 2-epimerase (non-hydrolyzing) [Candidatus Omnitrophota bacterium]
MKKTVVTIVGARPQFIKALPLANDMQKVFDSKVIHTGQHYDYEMSQIFFSQLDIPEPDCNLNIGSGAHGVQTAEMIKRTEQALKKYKPALVLVFGDTNSTLAGALAAAKMNIPVAHVEAGMRSFRRSMPEEVNRVVSDHVSSVLLCSTENARKNLKKEGLKDRAFVTGDIMYDALKKVLPLCRENGKMLERLGLEKKKYHLLTLHRDYNTDNKKGLAFLLKKLGQLNEKIVFPVHPRTRKAIKSFGLWDALKKQKNIMVLEPLGYVDFLTLQKNAKTILTDSGGVQKEAYLLKVPCITLRDETEWVETLKGNANVLAGRYGSRLKKAVRRSGRGRRWDKDIFGNGNASKKILKILDSFLQKEERAKTVERGMWK